MCPARCNKRQTLGNIFPHFLQLYHRRSPECSTRNHCAHMGGYNQDQTKHRSSSLSAQQAKSKSLSKGVLLEGGGGLREFHVARGRGSSPMARTSLPCPIAVCVRAFGLGAITTAQSSCQCFTNHGIFGLCMTSRRKTHTHTETQSQRTCEHDNLQQFRLSLQD